MSLRGKHLILYADGGARGNPGPAGAGAYLEDESGRAVARIYKYLGETTNNVAEYSALIFGLKEAQRRSAETVAIRMDSQLVVRQVLGEYKVKEPRLQKLHQQVSALLEGFGSFRIEHIPREENQEADKLANLAIDKHFGE
ncbi:MAG TPA: ribonuclease H [Deltaproteobacteria bacterium]|nr:ribonuclease H [Deltaproteobacteria bacterium]